MFIIIMIEVGDFMQEHELDTLAKTNVRMVVVLAYRLRVRNAAVNAILPINIGAPNVLL